MKILILFIFLICVSNAENDIFKVLDSITDNVKDKIDAIKQSRDKLTYVLKTGFNTGITAFKDTIHSAFDYSKPPPRIAVPDLIKEAGYPVESHYVTTVDGYILNIHRIPYGKHIGRHKNKVVYLQHGMLCASSDWVLFGPKHGLAYALADEGYDVWMGNVRGNFYSRNHTVLYPDTDAEYWKFSWNEMGIIDIPAMIDYILKTTQKESIYYVGHSQGNTVFYVMASEKPEYNKKVKVQISLAPVGYVKNTVSPLLKLIAQGNEHFDHIMEFLGQNEFIPPTGLFRDLTSKICGQNLGRVFCKNSMFSMFGFSPKQVNISNFGLLFAHYPAGAATKQIVHYQQEVISERFCKFDFGPSKNNETYHQPYPPAYDLSKISAPVFLIYSSHDWLTHELDVDRLSRELGNFQDKYLVPVSPWNHLDFLFGNDAPKVIYQKVIETLAKY